MLVLISLPDNVRNCDYQWVSLATFVNWIGLEGPPPLEILLYLVTLEKYNFVLVFIRS